MRAKKKNQLQVEKQEKLIHKETIRFLSMLNQYSNDTLAQKSYCPNLYENIANHIREYLEHPETEQSSLRDYLNNENKKIKDLIIEDKNYDYENKEFLDKDNKEETSKRFFLNTIKQENFSNLKTLSVQDDFKKDFIALNQQPFLYKFLISNKKNNKISRRIKYYCLKIKRSLR